MTLTITSDSFTHGNQIPATYTCQGKDIAPPLQWRDVPENAKTLVLIVDDPDAPDPDAPQRTYVHWVLYDIPPDSSGLKEGAIRSDLPSGTMEGLNDWNRTGYGGPCPPIGRHRYFFKLYALDIALADLQQPTKAIVKSAMQGHVIEEAVLMGTYEKSR